MMKELNKDVLKRMDKAAIEKMGLGTKELNKCIEVAGTVTRELVVRHIGTCAQHLRILYSSVPNTEKGTALQLVMDQRFNERVREEMNLNAYEATALCKVVMPAYAKAISNKVQGRTEALEELMGLVVLAG